MEELKSLAELFGCNNNIYPHGINKKRNYWDPFIWINIPNDDIIYKICKRAMCIKGIYQIYSYGKTINNIVNDMKNNFDYSKLDKYLDKSFRLTSIWFGKKCSQNIKLSEIKLFEFFTIKLKGKVSLNKPEIEYHLISNYGDHTQLRLNTANDIPYDIYFGRFICGSNRTILKDFNLTDRLFVGPTSLDPELSFIMSNMGKCTNNSIIFDPFVGTGSIIIACAYHGSYVIGSDIDMRVLRGGHHTNFDKRKKRTNLNRNNHGTSKYKVIRDKNDEYKENIYTTFKQYGLITPELIRCDLNLHSFNDYLIENIDAIICDPPYGVRAGARKSGIKGDVKPVPKKYHETHKPRTQIYNDYEVIYDLLNFAGKYIKIHGRLVYILPCTNEFNIDKDLPQHPCMKCVGNSEQQCQGIMRRRLITMEKYKKWEIGMVPIIPKNADYIGLKDKIIIPNPSKKLKKLNKKNNYPESKKIKLDNSL